MKPERKNFLGYRVDFKTFTIRNRKAALTVTDLIGVITLSNFLKLNISDSEKKI
jgi:hypothetical protein